MSIEEKLKTKTFYRQFVAVDQNPVEQLGELLFDELKKDIPDAADIRFSQGEVYFHYKDYEAAIYKWKQIANELAPWARKNIADAYFELGETGLAEETYRSIETDSNILKMEVKFQLFNLYYQEKRMEEASQVLKEAVDLQPDYPNITKIARMFFEERNDWMSAIELAKRESLRTESPVWFERLKSYIHRGYTATLPPAYFTEVLTSLLKIDPDFFEQFVLALWRNYQDTELFTDWLSVVNHILTNLDMERESTFPELARMYEKAYRSLSHQGLTLEQLKPLVSELLYAWVQIADRNQALLPAAAIFAWHDRVSDSVTSETLDMAEKILFAETEALPVENQVDEIGECLIQWAEEHQLVVDQRLLAIRDYLQEHDTFNIAIAGMARREFFYQIFTEKVYVPTPLVPVFYHYGTEPVVRAHGRDFSQILEQNFDPQTDGIKTDGRFYVKITPHRLLKEANVSLLDFPEVYSSEHAPLIEAMDAVFYFLQPNLDHFQDELLELKWLRKEYPDLIIHAVTSPENAAISEYQKDVENIIRPGRLTTYDSIKDYDTLFQLVGTKDKKDRVVLQKVIVLLQRLIHDFLQQRVRAEHHLHDSIQKKEDILQRLNGANYQLSDLQTELGERIANAFSLIQTDLEKEIADKLPGVLKATAEEIPDSIDPTTIHVEVNKMMNRKINEYLNGEILDKLTGRARDWLILAREELEEGRAFLEEIENGFNRMLGDERLQINCDFQILDDWQRDIDRFTAQSVIPEENILLRFTPGQILLKGAGKVLGNFAKGKPFVIQQYKNFIASEDYRQVVERVSEQFFSLFKLMEQGLARDVSLFFRDALRAIQDLIHELEEEIATERNELEQLREHPEKFRDPLTLFEIQLLENRYLLEFEQPAHLR